MMITPSPDFVSTDLGRLHVRRAGTGPPVVLFHSLFVDSTSWGPLVDALAQSRTVFTIDAPSHGESEAVDHDFTFDDLVAAAQQALDRLGLTEPVDWVGNALGGHIGIHLAAAEHPRLRTLTTIGTPVQAFTLGEKLTKGWPLVHMYRLTGPNAFLVKLLSDSLLGSKAIAARPDQAARVMSAFAEADRSGMWHAMRSMMLRRSGVEDLLPHITVPTLVLSVRDDVMGWRPDEARQTCATIPECHVEEVAGGGHVAPLLIDSDRIARLLTEFWAAHGAETAFQHEKFERRVPECRFDANR
jgi:pimeloyl-ACP methyl ester carboxylesterase